ncbi:MAG: methionyl-tRNA formyltransferase [Patescibacteria group bacterium]|jgi:methionyl-tRNA formyltransferase
MKKEKYNIIFIGTPDFSVPTLEALIANERFSITAVVTAPDARVGRKQILTPPPVKTGAQKHGLKILQPKNIVDIADKIGKIQVDVIITIAYGQILPEIILKIPKYGCLNLHASLLPKYQGASPIQTAIANGDKETGVTLMKMDKGMDTGDIIAREKINITKEDTGEKLHDKLSKLSAEVAIKYIADYIEGRLKLQKQNEKQASQAPKLTRDSGKINWSKSAEEIERLIRAYYPWPGTWCKWNSKTLKIISVSNIIQINKHKPGAIFLHNKELAVQCAENAITIKELQLEGKNKMTSQEFLAGHKDISNSVSK